MTKVRGKSEQQAPSDGDEGSGKQTVPAATEYSQLQDRTASWPEGRATPEGGTPPGTPSTLSPQTTSSTARGDDGEPYETITRDTDDDGESESTGNTRVARKSPVETGGAVIDMGTINTHRAAPV